MRAHIIVMCVCVMLGWFPVPPVCAGNQASMMHAVGCCVLVEICPVLQYWVTSGSCGTIRMYKRNNMHAVMYACITSWVSLHFDRRVHYCFFYRLTTDSTPTAHTVCKLSASIYSITGRVMDCVINSQTRRCVGYSTLPMSSATSKRTFTPGRICSMLQTRVVRFLVEQAPVAKRACHRPNGKKTK